MDDDYQVYISDVWGAVGTLDGSDNDAVEAKQASADKAVKSEGDKTSPVVPRPGPLISEAQRVWTKLAEPPDISFRQLIDKDADIIDKLLKDHDIHFERRCLRYKSYDAYLEWEILFDYAHWIYCEQLNWKEGEEEFKFYDGLFSAVLEQREDADKIWHERVIELEAWESENKTLVSDTEEVLESLTDQDHESAQGVASSADAEEEEGSSDFGSEKSWHTAASEMDMNEI